MQQSPPIFLDAIQLIVNIIQIGFKNLIVNPLIVTFPEACLQERVGYKSKQTNK